MFDVCFCACVRAYSCVAFFRPHGRLQLYMVAVVAAAPKDEQGMVVGSIALCSVLYHVNVCVSVGYSLGLAGVLHWRPELTKWCGRHFVLLKLLQVAFSAVAVAVWPGEDGWGFVIATDVLMLQCWMGTLSLRNTIILTSTALIAFLAVMGALGRLSAFALIKVVALAAGAAWIARSANYRQRITWRLHHLFQVNLVVARKPASQLGF